MHLKEINYLKLLHFLKIIQKQGFLSKDIATGKALLLTTNPWATAVPPPLSLILPTWVRINQESRLSPLVMNLQYQTQMASRLNLIARLLLSLLKAPDFNPFSNSRKKDSKDSIARFIICRLKLSSGACKLSSLVKSPSISASSPATSRKSRIIGILPPSPDILAWCQIVAERNPRE